MTAPRSLFVETPGVPRPVFVGELNPYGDRPFAALLDVPAGASGDRLCRLVCGLSSSRYRRFPRYDLCVGKWSAKAARSRAGVLLGEHARSDVFVLLGRKVAEAFGVADLAAFSWIDAPDRRIVLLPHPSGRCRDWQEPGTFERARTLLSAALPHVPWGEALSDRVAS